MSRPHADGRARHVRGLLVVAFFVLATMGFFKPTVVDGGTFSTVGAVQRVYFPWQVTNENGLPFYPQSDQAQSFHPRQVFLDRALHDGELPAWDPYTFAGHPYLSNGANSFFYPVRQLVTWVSGPALAHDLFLMTHMVLAGCSMYFLLRTLGRSVPGGLVGGLAWMWNPFAMAWAQLELLPPVVALLPLALAFVHRAHHRRSVVDRLGAGVTCGAMLLGASLDLAAVACGIVGSYALVLEGARLWRERDGGAMVGRAVRGAGRVAAIPVVAFGIGAPALIPFAMLSGRFARQPIDYSTFESSVTVPLRTFAGLWWHPGFPFTDTTMHRMAFVGTPIALLAVVGLLRRRPGSGLAAGLLIGSLAVLGRTPFVAVLDALSGNYRFLSLGRFMFGWALGLVVLAVLGFDLLVDAARRRIDRDAVTWFAAGAVLIATGLQLFRYDRSINADFIPRERAFLFPTTPAIDALLARRTGPAADRNLPVLRPELQPLPDSSIPLVFPFESGAGYESSLPSSIADLWRVVGGEPVDEVVARDLSSGLVALFPTDRTRFDLLPRVGVTSVLAPPNIEEEPGWDDEGLARRGLARVYDGDDADLLEVVEPSPRAFVVHRATVEPDPDRALAQFTDPDFPWQTTALLLTDDRDLEIDNDAAPTAARVVEHDLDTVRVEVDDPEPGYLILLDSFDDGWTATVDGAPADVLHADGAFRAVAVPGGASEVEFRYTTPGLRAGIGTGLVTLVAASVVAALSRRRGLLPT